MCGRPDRDRAQVFKGTDICSGLCDQVVKGQLTKEEAMRRHKQAIAAFTVPRG